MDSPFLDLVDSSMRNRGEMRLDHTYEARHGFARQQMGDFASIVFVAHYNEELHCELAQVFQM